MSLIFRSSISNMCNFFFLFHVPTFYDNTVDDNGLGDYNNAAALLLSAFFFISETFEINIFHNSINDDKNHQLSCNITSQLTRWDLMHSADSPTSTTNLFNWHLSQYMRRIVQGVSISYFNSDDEFSHDEEVLRCFHTCLTVQLWKSIRAWDIARLSLLKQTDMVYDFTCLMKLSRHSSSLRWIKLLMHESVSSGSPFHTFIAKNCSPVKF